MSVRAYRESDLEEIKKSDMMFGLQVRWNGNFKDENVLVCEEGGEIVGAGALSFDPSWCYMEREIQHKLHLDVCVGENAADKEKVYDEILTGLIGRFEEMKRELPGKNLCVCYWTSGNEIQNMQVYLKKGFFMKGVTPVLRYNLEKEVVHYQIPDEITIEPLRMDTEKNMNAYLEATGEAHDGICDSKADLRFRSGADNFEVYVAKDGDRIVGGITLWDFSKEHSATEDIFTVPDYRKKNIARELIATGLEQLKKRGQKQATLSLLGDNVNAMRLYEAMGYELLYLLIELNYR